MLRSKSARADRLYTESAGGLIPHDDMLLSPDAAVAAAQEGLRSGQPALLFPSIETQGLLYPNCQTWQVARHGQRA
jgi:hypothetical protein